MLLTETIKNCITAINTRRAILENKHYTEIYAKALSQLAGVNSFIRKTFDCAHVMKEQGIINEPIIDANTKQDILDCIDDCGNAICERTLTLDTVHLLQSKGDTIHTQIKLTWKSAAKKYSEGIKGYLSMIGGLSENPQRVRTLIDNIDKAVSKEPTRNVIISLIENVAEAKSITDTFALNKNIEAFLQKVSLQQATVDDLNPIIMDWLKEKHLTKKLYLKF